MAREITIGGEKAKKGERMHKGKGWRIVAVKGRKRVFIARLLDTVNYGKQRLAVFSVPK